MCYSSKNYIIDIKIYFQVSPNDCSDKKFAKERVENLAKLTKPNPGVSGGGGGKVAARKNVCVVKGVVQQKEVNVVQHIPVGK